MSTVLRAAFLAAVWVVCALAQNSSFQGVVTDNSGAVIPGAQIQLTNLSTGVATNVSSNAAGFYVVPALNPGQYKILCSSEGFAPTERPQVNLEVGQVARVDFQLNVGT
ncbi:MAG: carboxypeptidase-like regulatory domain-containing protein, partial [Bryobacterales bacterium]